jgi:hypothetical protein
MAGYNALFETLNHFESWRRAEAEHPHTDGTRLQGAGQTRKQLLTVHTPFYINDLAFKPLMRYYIVL